MTDIENNTETYFDINPDSVGALIGAIPKVVAWLKETGGDELLVGQMFFIDEDDGEGETIDRNYPCCTMGHVIHEAGLADAIGYIENEESPANYFLNPAISREVQKIATLNDETGTPDRIPKLVDALWALQGRLIRIEKGGK